ncbi:MAG: HEAT repeat domain-containing protein [Kiritimatiellae bacterium]|nr:HEAT repeat domain-containing protein [Kiritimatiellia bacterium]
MTLTTQIRQHGCVIHAEPSGVAGAPPSNIAKTLAFMEGRAPAGPFLAIIRGLATVTILTLAVATAVPLSAQAKPVIGLFKDARSGELAGIRKTLEAEGFDTRELNTASIQARTNLDGLSAIYLPGGWNSGDFAGFTGRRNLVDFAAGGGGVFAGAFRSGYVRTINRPLFPEIGATDNRINGMWVKACGDSPLVAGLDRPFCLTAGWDHMVIKIGPQGRVFLADADGNPAGAYGSVYGGRYIAFGGFLGGTSNALEGVERTFFLNCMRWLTAGAPQAEAERAQLREAAELAFLRQDKLYDFTLDEHGPDVGPGILPMIRNRLEIPLFARRQRLSAAAAVLPSAEAQPLRAVQARLDLALAQLERRYAGMTAEWTNRIRSMKREELVRDNPFLDPDGVLARAVTLGVTTNVLADLRLLLDVNRKMVAANQKIQGSSQTNKRVAELLYGATLRAAMFSRAESDALVAEADALLKQAAPAVAKARETARQAERKRDTERVPGYIRDCGNPDARVRAEAALELGRIGDKRGASVLIKALDDQDATVRVRAIQSLAWMQAGEAVPKLIELLKGSDLRIQRRAAQALGQIGDPRAAAPLLECLAADDFHLKVNAILALGWLRSKEAVPPLIKLLESGDPQDPDVRGQMQAALRALATIGDPAVLPVLEKLAKTAKDFPAPRRSSARINNPYSTAQSLGLQGHAEIAIKAIKEGRKNAPGIAQAADLALANRFYALERNVNLLIGRPFTVINSNFGEEPEAILDYFQEAGVTGIHAAWGEQNDDPDRYLKLIRKAGEYDMKWIDVLPMDGNIQGSRDSYKRLRQAQTAEKAGCDFVLEGMRDLPAFTGFWSEEDYPAVGVSDAAFEQFLRAKYGPDFRKAMGLAADEPVAVPKIEDQWKRRRLFTEFNCVAGQILLDEWREDQEWLQGLRKGCVMTFNNTVGCRFTYIGVAGGAGGILGGHGPETYESFGRENAFMMELAKDGEPRPVLCEFYNMYAPSNEHSERGFAQHLMHGECFYPFSLNQIFKQSNPYTMWSWEAGRWERLSQVFNKAAKVKPYLAGASSAANVALVASERTHILFYAKEYGERVSLSRRYYQHQRALWVALQQSHAAADAIWAETLTPEKAARYAVLVLSDAKSLTAAEMDVLRKWVEAGGILIASGTTSLFNEWGEQQANYALADVFGVRYEGHVALSDPKAGDTVCWENGRSLFPAIDEGLDPERIRYQVHREIKPVSSIGMYQVGSADAMLPGLPAAGLTCEYDLPLGRDRIKPDKAKVLATWPDGSAALTVNRFGKGACYFWTPIYPALCHTASGWEMEPNVFDFWPGTRDVLAAMVRGGLAARQATLAAEPFDCPKDVEITVRKTADGKSLVVHLLNYDPNLSRVHGINLAVRPLASGSLRVFYPDTGDTASFVRMADGRIMLTVRDFGVHEMLVVEAGVAGKAK